MSARRLWRTIEQQVRLSHSLRQAVLLPRRVLRHYRQNVEASSVIVPDEFDLKHGTETSARVYPADLALSHPNWIHASPYFPTPSRLLKETVQLLNLDVKPLTFVDLGSGKGRVLLMASALPFRRIVGVELSAQLSVVAARNLAVYQGEQRCTDIRIECGDFTEFVFPAEPLFVFLYHPASAELSKVLARNLARSIRAFPREVWVLYVTPQEGVFEQEEFARVAEGECCGHPYRVWRSR